MPTDELERGLEAEIAKARAQLARGMEPMKVLETFSRTLTNKLLHPTIEALKRSC